VSVTHGEYDARPMAAFPAFAAAYAGTQSASTHQTDGEAELTCVVDNMPTVAYPGRDSTCGVTSLSALPLRQNCHHIGLLT